ncbi:MAG: TmcC family electron transfer complex membrane anchor subunit [Pseudomonadota bacterium]
MYEFSRGPLVWIAFAVFIIGSIYRLVTIIRLARKEKVIMPYLDFKFGMRSVLHWLAPFGSRSMRMRPVFSILSLVFHICLIVTPIFLLGHNLLWKESWNIIWWTLPENIGNIMAIIVVVIGFFFILRRVANPTVRFVTSWVDYVFMVIVLGPFVTGVMAYYQVFDYRIVMMLHMWTGAIWLMAIPFTRVSHMLFFVLTRAYMGCEFGFVRNARDW